MRKRRRAPKEEKDWHVEERSFGSFYRSMSLPFEPEDGAVDAHFNKGVLRLTIKKPAKAINTSKRYQDGHQDRIEVGRLVPNE